MYNTVFYLHFYKQKYIKYHVCENTIRNSLNLLTKHSFLSKRIKKIVRERDKKRCVYSRSVLTSSLTWNMKRLHLQVTRTKRIMLQHGRRRTINGAIPFTAHKGLQTDSSFIKLKGHSHLTVQWHNIILYLNDKVLYIFIRIDSFNLK